MYHMAALPCLFLFFAEAAQAEVGVGTRVEETMRSDQHLALVALVVPVRTKKRKIKEDKEREGG